MKYRLNNPIPLPIDRLAPGPELFTQRSRLHGQAHVSRVIVHAFVLVEALGLEELAPKAWAAAYIHDLGRRHDGICHEHGRYALEKLPTLPEVQDLLDRGGVSAADWESISVAVDNHCRAEIPKTHAHWTLTAVLKDADGLDRVRLGDLDPRYLRFPKSRDLIGFAEALYQETNGRLPVGAGHFAALWPVAERLISGI